MQSVILLYRCLQSTQFNTDRLDNIITNNFQNKALQMQQHYELTNFNKVYQTNWQFISRILCIEYVTPQHVMI